jgi:hypothetical protein
MSPPSGLHRLQILILRQAAKWRALRKAGPSPEYYSFCCKVWLFCTLGGVGNILILAHPPRLDSYYGLLYRFDFDYMIFNVSFSAIALWTCAGALGDYMNPRRFAPNAGWIGMLLGPVNLGRAALRRLQG